MTAEAAAIAHSTLARSGDAAALRKALQVGQ